MSGSELRQAKEVAIEAARQAGYRLKPHWGQIEHVTKGEQRELVTDLDKSTELFLAEEFKKFDDRIGFRGEEFGTQRQAELMWLVDPIDGTTHFIRGLPFCTIMIALIEKGQPVLGIIHDFIRDETYWAIKGQGAFRDDEPIRVNNCSLTDNAMLCYETEISNPACLEAYLKVWHELRRSSLGGIALTINSGFELAMIASGKLDARITFHGFGKDYDYAPGSIIVEEAGGIVRNIGNNSYDYTNCNFIAANPLIYQQLTAGEDAIFPLSQEI